MTSPIALLSAWKLHPKKKFGQNFLKDPQTAEMIINHCNLTSNDTILEIGAGFGAITVPAALRSKKVYAVEIDQRIYEMLKNELLLHNIFNVDIIKDNIMKIHIKDFVEKAGHKITVLGNLPYNISSQILIKLIKERAYINRAVIMLQKEMATRLTAKPDCRDYGRLSVMLQYCADISKITDLKATCFFPRPKIDSTVIEIKFNNRYQYQADNESLFFRTIKAAFSKRRKTLRNSLAGNLLNINTKTAGIFLEKAGIDPSRRAETLTVSEFIKLNNSLNQDKGSPKNNFTF